MVSWVCRTVFLLALLAQTGVAAEEAAAPQVARPESLHIQVQQAPAVEPAGPAVTPEFRAAPSDCDGSGGAAIKSDFGTERRDLITTKRSVEESSKGAEHQEHLFDKQIAIDFSFGAAAQDYIMEPRRAASEPSFTVYRSRPPPA